MISVQCACGKAFMTKPANAGKKTKCPSCGDMLTIPGGAAAGADEIDELLGSWPPVSAPLATQVPPPQVSAMVHDQIASSRSVNGGMQAGPLPASGRGNRPSTLEGDSNVLAGLFDLNFRQFITPAIIRALYLSHLVLVAICVAVLMLFNYLTLVRFASNEFGTPWIQYLILIFTNLMVFFILFMGTLVVRLGLEAVMVLFRGEEHLRTLVKSDSHS